MWYYILVAKKAHNFIPTEKSRSWSSAHDWKSCNRQKRFESSNLSFSAKKQRIATAILCFFVAEERFEHTRNASRDERENSPTPPVADEVGEFEWQRLRFLQPSDQRGQKKSVVATVQAACCAINLSASLLCSSAKTKRVVRRLCIFSGESTNTTKEISLVVFFVETGLHKGSFRELALPSASLLAP